MADKNVFLASGNKLYLNDTSAVGNQFRLGSAVTDVANMAGNFAGNTFGYIDSVSSTKGSYKANETFNSNQVIYAEGSKYWTIIGTGGATKGNDTIYLGDGGGNVVGNGGRDTVFFGSGKDTFVLNATGNAEIKYYEYGKDKIEMGLKANGFTFAGEGKIVDTKNNDVTLLGMGDVGRVTFQNGNDGGTADLNVWFNNATGKAVKMDATANSESIYFQTTGTYADTVLGGKGADTIEAKGNAVVWGGAGKDEIWLSGGKNSVGLGAGTGMDTVTGFQQGFDAASDVVWLFDDGAASSKVTFEGTTSSKGNMTVAIGSDKLTLKDVALDNGNSAQILVKSGMNGEVQKAWIASTDKDAAFQASGGNFADIYIGGGKVTTLDFSLEDAGKVIDLSNSGLYGDKSSYRDIDNVIGGIGADTLIGAGDVDNILTGSEGDDHIWGRGVSSDTLVGDAVGEGKDTFYFGKGDGKDFIEGYVLADDIVNLHSQNGLAGLKFGFNDSKEAYVRLDSGEVLTFASGATTSNGNFALVNFSDITGDSAKIAWGNGANVVFDQAADYYYGDAKGNNWIDVGALGGDVGTLVDLRHDKYTNINNIKGSANADTLIGSGKTAAIIEGGIGDEFIYGGGAKSDTLSGGAGADQFFFGIGDGKDVVTDFNKDEDKLVLWSQPASVGVKRNANGDIIIGGDTDNITLKANQQGLNATEVAVINVQNSDGSELVAAIGRDGNNNTFAFDPAIGAYYGGDKRDKIEISGMDDVEIWLDNRDSAQFFNSIEELDATNATGSVVLAGARDTDNVITAGKGGSSLWGGDGKGNDTLKGGAGADVFYFGAAEGNDVIMDGDALDKVMVYTPNFAESSTTLSSGTLTITSTAGNTLTVKGWSEDGLNTFELADGTKWGYSEQDKAWKEKK